MLKLFKMIKKRRFVVIGEGNAFFQPAYVDDVVAGFLLCLEKEEAIGEPFIIGGDEYVPLRELIALIAGEFGVDPPGLRIPMAPMKWGATLCEAIFPPLGIEPPLHHRRLSFFRNNRAFDVGKAKELLGFEPQVSLREGLRRTAHWDEEHGWL